MTDLLNDPVVSLIDQSGPLHRPDDPALYVVSQTVGPGGFLITAAACAAYRHATRTIPVALYDEVHEAIQRAEAAAHKCYGGPESPLLISVRSVTPAPGTATLESIRNLGLNDVTVAGLIRTSRSARFAWDCYRRLVQTYGVFVAGVPHASFEKQLAEARVAAGVRSDSELHAGILEDLTIAFRNMYCFPQDVDDQLWGAVRASFDSWEDRNEVGVSEHGDCVLAVEVHMGSQAIAVEDAGPGIFRARDARWAEPAGVISEHPVAWQLQSENRRRGR